MIALLANRPAIQVGKHQVHDYDTVWLASALQRAADAADRHDFPFLDEILRGIEEYLETRCSLRMLPLQALFDRMRHMLETIGCDSIAANLEPLAPPVTVSLVESARNAGNGFELAFFNILRGELGELRKAGVEEVRFTGLRDCSLMLCGRKKWHLECDLLLAEIRAFIASYEFDNSRSISRPLRLSLEGA